MLREAQKEVKAPWFTHDRKVKGDDGEMRWALNNALREKMEEVSRKRTEQEIKAGLVVTDHDPDLAFESGNHWAECEEVSCKKWRVASGETLNAILEKHGKFRCKFL